MAPVHSLDMVHPSKQGLQRCVSTPNLLQLDHLMLQLRLDGSASRTEQAAEELSHLTRKASYRAAMMRVSGGVSSFVGSLSSNNPAVARHAAACLQNLAIEPEHCSSIVAAGAIDALLTLLQAPDDSDAVLAAAAGALSNLANDTQSCRKIAAAPGCMQRLTQLLSHASCVVREAAASVVGKLAWEPELCGPLAAAGAVKPLVTLLDGDLSDDGGRQVAAAALENLTYDNTTIRKALVDAGAVPLLVSLLDSDSEAAQRSAAGALHNLALARAHCVKIAAAGGIEPLVELLETSSSDAVQAVAGGTLGKLALEPAHRAEIVECREKLLESDSSC